MKPLVLLGSLILATLIVVVSCSGPAPHSTCSQGCLPGSHCDQESQLCIANEVVVPQPNDDDAGFDGGDDAGRDASEPAPIKCDGGTGLLTYAAELMAPASGRKITAFAGSLPDDLYAITDRGTLLHRDPNSKVGVWTAVKEFYEDGQDDIPDLLFADGQLFFTGGVGTGSCAGQCDEPSNFKFVRSPQEGPAYFGLCRQSDGGIHGVGIDGDGGAVLSQFVDGGWVAPRRSNHQWFVRCTFDDHGQMVIGGIGSMFRVTNDGVIREEPADDTMALSFLRLAGSIHVVGVGDVIAEVEAGNWTKVYPPEDTDASVGLFGLGSACPYEAHGAQLEFAGQSSLVRPVHYANGTWSSYPDAGELAQMTEPFTVYSVSQNEYYFGGTCGTKACIIRGTRP